jgi:hypothetical protein
VDAQQNLCCKKSKMLNIHGTAAPRDRIRPNVNEKNVQFGNKRPKLADQRHRPKNKRQHLKSLVRIMQQRRAAAGMEAIYSLPNAKFESIDM